MKQFLLISVPERVLGCLRGLVNHILRTVDRHLRCFQFSKFKNIIGQIFLLSHPFSQNKPLIRSDQISRSVMSDSLRPHESQHARPPYPSPTPGVHSDSTSIESVMPSSHLILCRPHLLLPPIPPSIRVFSNESTLHMRWPKYWSFSFSIIPSKEIQG